MRSTLAGQYYAVASLIAETDLADESVAITGFAIWTVAGVLIALAILGITIYYGLEALIVFIIMQGEGSATTVIVAFIVVAFIRQRSIGLGSESIMTTKIGEIVERWPSLQLYWAAHEAQRERQLAGDDRDRQAGGAAAYQERGHADEQVTPGSSARLLWPEEVEKQSAATVATLFTDPLPTSALGRAFTV